MPVIGTCEGRLLDPAKDIDLGEKDIAAIVINECTHAISNLCRYGGQTSSFYSVAKHTLLLLEILKYLTDEDLGLGPSQDREDLEIALLMHDFHEAYIVDLPRPLKKMLPEYCALEKKIEGKVASILGCDKFDPKIIKIRDALDIAICEFVEIPVLSVGTSAINPIDASQGFKMFFNHLMYADIIRPEFAERAPDVSDILEDYLYSLVGEHRSFIVRSDLRDHRVTKLLKAGLGVEDD